MKDLKPGTRIYLSYQRFVHALWFGTAVVVSYDPQYEEYVIDRDPGTATDKLAPLRQCWPEHHAHRAKYQPGVEPAERVLPGVYPAVSKRLIELGYRKGTHFDVPLEPSDEMV
jgi:hypothetical protein